MKTLFLALLLVLTACQSGTPVTPVDPVNPVNPVVPVNPDAPSHATGFLYKPGQVGLMAGAAFAVAPANAQIPKSFSWVSVGFGTPVRDQGNCGSCWAFGSTQMLDGAVKIYDGKDVTLSEQQLVAYDRAQSAGCSGGYFSGDYLVAHGLVLNSDCPYTASNGGCPGGKPTTYAAKPTAWSNLGTGNGSPTVVQIQQAILQYGVVACDVAATSAWNNPSATAVLSGKSSGINHIIAIVGWDNDKQAWRLKNSWGTAWADSGYVWIKYGAFSVCNDAAFLQYSSQPAFLQIGK